MNMSQMSRGRHSTMQATPRSVNEAPVHQPPTFPLNAAAQRALAQLARSSNLTKLNRNLNDAQTQLTDTAGQMNDRVTEATSALQRSREKRQKEKAGPDEEQEALAQKLAQFQEKVDGMTQRMEESMRKLIDHQHSVEAITQSLSKTEQHARNTASTQASTQHGRTQRATRRTMDGEEDDENMSGGEEEYPDFTPTDPAGGTPAQRAPVDVFRSNVDDAILRYQSKSQAERYTDEKAYYNFREVVHDAVHQGDAEQPPLDKSKWFSEGGAPAPGITRRNVEADEDEDDDLAISKETISTKCPLTLLEFVEPYTSKKCPHSFEKQAILALIHSSEKRTTPKSGQRQGEKFVVCPVGGGCKEQLTCNDLGVDRVIVRKIQRLQRSKQLQQEEDENDSDAGQGGTQNRAFSIDDDGEDDVDEEPAVRPKAEPRPTGGSNRPPQSSASRSTQVIDLSDEEEGEDEDEDEEDSMVV